MILTGKNISLRALEPSDIDVLYKWENDTSAWQLSNTLTPFSKHVLEQYLSVSHNDIYTTKQLRLVISDSDKRPVGCVDLFDFEPAHHRSGVGILISDKNDRGKGYASETLDVFIPYCFNTLNLRQLYCNITSDNEHSLALFKKYGFQISGTKKQWIRHGNAWKDEHLLQLIA